MGLQEETGVVKNNCLYEIHYIYSSLFPYLGYSTDIQIYRNRKWSEQSPDIQYSERYTRVYVVSHQ